MIERGLRAALNPCSRVAELWMNSFDIAQRYKHSKIIGVKAAVADDVIMIWRVE